MSFKMEQIVKRKICKNEVSYIILLPANLKFRLIDGFDIMARTFTLVFPYCSVEL